LIKKFCENWAFSNFNIATAALCYALCTCIVYQASPIKASLLILIFSATLANYIFHRIFPVYQYKYKAHPNSIFQWTIDHFRFLKLTFVVALIALALTFFKQNYLSQICLILLALLTLLYSIPIIKTNEKRKRLRDIGYLKILLIAFTWALVCGNLSLLEAKESYTYTQHLSVFVEKFFYIIAITIPFDIRDMQYDKSIGVKTIPVRFGVVGAIGVALICLVVSFVILTCSTNQMDVQWAYALVYGVTAYFILESAQTKSNFFFLFYMDGLMILLLVCLVVFGFF